MLSHMLFAGVLLQLQPFELPPALKNLLGGAVCVAITVVIVAAIVAALFGRGGRGALEIRRRDLLSPAEHVFLLALEQAVGGRYRIAMKVRLGDLLHVPGRGPDPTRLRNRINQKHIDFVLCERETIRPILAIELDDRTHDRSDRRSRDEFVNDCADRAQLPLLRVKCRRDYDPRQLALSVDRILCAAPSTR